MSSFPSCDMTYSGLRSAKTRKQAWFIKLLHSNRYLNILKMNDSVRTKIAHLEL